MSKGHLKPPWSLCVAGIAAIPASTALALAFSPSRSASCHSFGELERRNASGPAFTLERPLHDQSTFFGRLMGMYDHMDPRTLLVSSQEIRRSTELLDEFRTTGRLPPGCTDREMWIARKNVEVSLHPVTGEELFRPGRVSASVLMNTPLCAMMLMANGPKQVVITQWINQTYNSVSNYVNRAGSTVDWSVLFQSYILAVTSACGISLGASSVIAAIPALQVLGPFVPYMAVVAAGSANMIFTRLEEWHGAGVPVFDKAGQELGMSRMAGQLGINQTVLTRGVILPIAPMVLPVLGMKVLRPFMVNKPVAVVSELCLIVACLAGALPVALAVLPQQMELDVSKLEPEFQGLTDTSGNPVTKVYANKGL